MKTPSAAKPKFLRNSSHASRGFSVIELLIVIAVGLVITTMAIVQLQPTLQQFRANGAASQVRGALRQARADSISNRRTIGVQFTTDAFGDQVIELFQYQFAGFAANGLPNYVIAAQPFMTLPIQSSVQFMVFPALPDTPDNFGNKSALCFGGPPCTAYAAGTILDFQSDGTFTDGTGTPIGGSIFMGIPNKPLTARAVTILGNTGRVRQYNSNGIGWFEQ